MNKNNNRRNQHQQQSAQFNNQMPPSGLNMSLSQGQQQNGVINQYNPDQENLKSYITDLKKAAIGNKKTRGTNGTNSQNRGDNAKLIAASNRGAIHGLSGGFNHPQTTKAGQNIHMFGGGQGGQNVDSAQYNSFQTQQKQRNSQMNTSKSGNMSVPRNQGSTPLAARGNSDNSQGYQIQLQNSYNFPQGMMSPVQGGANQNSAAQMENQQQPRAHSRQQSRQNHQSTNEMKHPDKASQLLKNYEQIIRKEKQSQNSYAVGQNTNLMKRVSNSNLNNKSLDKMTRGGQRSYSNLRKAQGGNNVMNLSQQKFYPQGGRQNIDVAPNTTKNNYGMSAQSGLSRALKHSDSRGGGQSDPNSNHNTRAAEVTSNRGVSQKDVIIRNNSSKKFLRPTSSSRGEASDQKNQKSGHYRNKTQVNMIQVDNSANFNSPSNYGAPMMNGTDTKNVGKWKNQISYGSKPRVSGAIGDTSTTNANSEINLSGGGQKRNMGGNRGNIGNAQAAQNAIQQQQLSMQLLNQSVGSGGIPMIDGNRGDLLLKNAKSLGNSLGTANKKSLNLSQNNDKILGMNTTGIERDQSTLNEGQFLTLAKTGLLNNLNLSQLIRSQNFLEEDGIEDLHFYFVSFIKHKNKLLDGQHKKKNLSQRKSSKQSKDIKQNIIDKKDGDDDHTIEQVPEEDIE